jgi:hypothetical protein
MRGRVQTPILSKKKKEKSVPSQAPVAHTCKQLFGRQISGRLGFEAKPQQIVLQTLSPK